ncbi:accessory protein regulator c [Bacillus sp. OxB-1]|uniref:sensor histidine kinase n=1 Tax=Bacillus sp. (strain OxB-1) TaxID=98228 RepID=UPI000581BA7D|nr:GHKL domain-containing protein [Bacillus sp. OxB-1]BAQ09580.1 accessory protein regulator c [Bacillus sp. OxB-1]
MSKTPFILGGIELIAIFSALFYLLGIRADIRKVSILSLGVVLPTILAFMMARWLGILILMISTTLIFYLFSRNIRVIIDLLSIFIGGILADHLAQIVNHPLFAGTSLALPIHLVCFLLLFLGYVYVYKRIIATQWCLFKSSPIILVLVVLLISATVFILYWNIFTISTENVITLVRINFVIQVGYVALAGGIFGLLFIHLQRQQQVKQREIKLEQYMMYMEALEQVNRDMQKFRHDYANILQTIQGYLDTDNLKDLKRYFKQHIITSGEHTLFRNRVLGSLDHLQLVGLRGLLATKSIEADEQGIQVSIRIPEPIDDIRMDIIDLTRIIGILMDNAIEANLRMEQGKVDVAFWKTDSPSIVIRIRNTTPEDTIRLTDLGRESFSTKGTDRGIGLSNVRQILQQYENALLKTQIEGQWFIQELEIFFVDGAG